MLPYHNLKAAHEYLIEHLPANSPYRSLDQKTWWSVARKTLMQPAKPIDAAQQAAA
jgi:fatty acid desaturase